MDSSPLEISLTTSAHELLPAYAHPGDGGADMRSAASLTIPPGCRATVPCGFSIAIPEGFAGFVVPRSGLAARHGITVLNAPGLIDSGYRGEIQVVLMNLDGEHDFQIKKGDRIAQLVIMKTPPVTFHVVDTLDTTKRGANGFGSTGIA